MLPFYSFKEVIFLFLAAVVITSQGFRQNPVLDDTDLEYYLEDGSSLIFKRDPIKTNMWFGPRLGRKKRSIEETGLGIHEKPDSGLIKFLQESPWAFIAFKGGKRRTVNFTPRLGRDSDEDYDNSVDSYGKSSSSKVQPGATFVRGSNTFTPRLGRYAPLISHDHL